MKSLSSAFQAHLDSGLTTLCWCWRVTRADGAVLGFTDHDRALSFDGTDFEPQTGFSPGRLHEGLDMSVDASEVQGILSSARISETDIIAGRYDGAGVEIWRVNWQDVSVRHLMRRGTLGQIRRGETAFHVEFRSLSHALNQPVGRTCQIPCDAQLGDARCGVDLNDPAFNGAGSVAALEGDRAFEASGLGAFASGLFSLGRLAWTSGANAGRVARVLRHEVAGGIVRLFLRDAPPDAVAAGDTFTVTAGCDKSRETCRDTFNNILNHRGFPDIPPDSTVLRVARAGGGYDGGVL